ncbi:MAG: apolipoprotein N-acyltransferase [Chthoniobacterales bacterium]|nr:apolipoprotein N-acyltransferase [Chthoniobacterales bacterium]
MEALKRLLRFWPWVAAVATGLLYRACFAPFNQAWLCWIALTPLVAAIWFSGRDSKRRWLRNLLLGYVAGVTFFWAVFSWLTTVTVPGWIIVGLYMGIYVAFWSWLCGALQPRKAGAVRPKRVEGLEAVTQRLAERRATQHLIPARAAARAELPPSEHAGSPWLSSVHNLRLGLLLACAWVTVEMLRATVFSGWGWNMLGSALHGQWALIQIAEFTGVPGLSFLVALTNVILVATVYRFILESQVRKSRPHFDFTLTMAMIMGVLVFGVRAVQLPQPSRSMRVAAVQPNIPREEKFNQEFAKTTFEKFNKLSQVALRSQPELLLWPESSMPDLMLPETESYRFVMDFSAATKVDLLLGIIDQDENAAYNAALLVSDGGTRTQLYRKLHLVPFGEYIPGRHLIPGLARIVGDQVPDDFGFGKEHTVFRMAGKDVQLAPLICFEDTIGELTRQFVLRGANLLANVTNDGWFLRSSGSQQHLANAVFRCVETRLPMVRSANTGVTCIINEFGRITQVLLDDNGSQFTEGVLVGDVAIPTPHRQTFYVRHGELFGKVCAGITVLTLLLVARRFFSRWREAA